VGRLHPGMTGCEWAACGLSLTVELSGPRELFRIHGAYFLTGWVLVSYRGVNATHA